MSAFVIECSSAVRVRVTGLPSISKYLNFDALRMPMPYLHNAVLKMPPIAPQPTPEDATVNLNFIAIPGTVVFIGGIVAAFLAGRIGFLDIFLVVDQVLSRYDPLPAETIDEALMLDAESRRVAAQALERRAA